MDPLNHQENAKKIANREFNRQAVVIIHGMGEQVPMETLRGFVKGITDWIKNFSTEAQKPRTWSRPEGISEHYETRKITMESTYGNVKTDFYEFYWAHHMRENTWMHFFTWAGKIATRSIKKVPKRLKIVWILVWAIILVIAGVILFAAYKWKSIENLLGKLDGISVFGIAALSTILYFLGKYILPILLSSLKGTIVNSAGDAARYMNPKTYNIGERSTIRREGIDFLKKLHDRTEKKYDKIIVVGHSLGSVVAYDLVRLLWQEYHEEFTPKEVVGHKIFKEMDLYSNGKTIENIDQFQRLQHECWRQYKNNGNKWLISDFITCAGAIAHIDYYITDNRNFMEKVNGKEIPVCPPCMESGDKTLFFGRKDFEIENEHGEIRKSTVEFLNHAALFAVTRWTNVYFTSDFVGSDANRLFGKGVKDVEIYKKSLIPILPKGHTNYWDSEKDNLALEAIAKAIGFNQLKAKE